MQYTEFLHERRKRIAQVIRERMKAGAGRVLNDLSNFGHDQLVRPGEDVFVLNLSAIRAVLRPYRLLLTTTDSGVSPASTRPS